MPASYIPEGYRLLKSTDIGKKFGTDLEPSIYIDNTVRIPVDYGHFDLVNFGCHFTNSNFSASYDIIQYHILTNYTSIYLTDSIGGSKYNFYHAVTGWLSSSKFTIPLVVDTKYEVSSISFPDPYGFFDEINNFIYVKDSKKDIFISNMDSLAKSITDKAGTTGKKSITELKGLVDNLKTTFTGQEKTVTPSKTSQVITPDTNYDGLSKVTVNPIPTDYIIPSGTLEITENGARDVTNYKNVNVNVPTPEPTYWDGSYTLSGLDSGYTLTLICSDSNVNVVNTDTFVYSLDSGATWNQFTSATMTLDNVSKIKFKSNSTGGTMKVGTTSSGSDIAYLEYEETDDISIISNTTMYVSAHLGGGGAD